VGRSEEMILVNSLNTRYKFGIISHQKVFHPENSQKAKNAHISYLNYMSKIGHYATLWQLNTLPL
jgi:hypothetical protein